MVTPPACLLPPHVIPSQQSTANTAASFITNTNWQSYAGESTMSHLTQMVGLTMQNFVSAATGMAVAIALVRGLARRSVDAIGNFWVDLVRGVLYILLPLAIVLALVLVARGVTQTLGGYVAATTLEGAAQTIAVGPLASQEAIKQLGTNGGGPFNTNAAHPFENPTPLTNFLSMLAIFVVPAGLVYTFGRMVGDPRQGWALWAAMAILFVAGLAVALPAEQAGNPLIASLGVDQGLSDGQAGGNFEGKETRFGIVSYMLYTVVTTAASCGAVNNMHDSLMPLAGLVPTLNMQLGEVIFGGVGAGLYGILVFAILAAAYRQENGLAAGAPVPVDAVTASASGLDPHISPANAALQAPRVARARNLPEAELRALIQRYTAGRTLGIFGEPRVNVLELNLALDARTQR